METDKPQGQGPITVEVPTAAPSTPEQPEQPAAQMTPPSPTTETQTQANQTPQVPENPADASAPPMPEQQKSGGGFLGKLFGRK